MLQDPELVTLIPSDDEAEECEEYEDVPWGIQLRKVLISTASVVVIRVALVYATRKMNQSIRNIGQSKY